MSAPVYALVRYLVSWACLWLAQHGWAIFNLDGPTTDAVTQILVGVGGAMFMAGIGAYKSRLPVLLARLKAHHKEALLASAADVPGVQKIIANPQIANATPSDKVVSSATE